MQHYNLDICIVLLYVASERFITLAIGAAKNGTPIFRNQAGMLSSLAAVRFRGLVARIRRYSSVVIVQYFSCDGRLYCIITSLRTMARQLPNFGPYASRVGNYIYLAKFCACKLFDRATYLQCQCGCLFLFPSVREYSYIAACT
jgi:hypothetical protein